MKIHIKQRDVSFEKTETYSFEEMESKTYAEIENKYYDDSLPEKIVKTIKYDRVLLSHANIKEVIPNG